MKKMKKYRLRNMISLVLSFLLTLLLSTLLLSISVRVGICNQDIFTRSVSNSDYYEVLYNKLNNHMYTLLEKAKLPKSVGEGVISESQVYIDGKVYINSVLKGKHPTIETKEIEEKLRSNIETYLSDHNIALKQMEDGIDEIIDTVVIDYKNSLQFKLADYFYDYSKVYSKWVDIIIVINVIFCPIIITLLLLMHHKKYHGMPYISYAALSASILNIIYTLYLLRSIKDWQILQGDAFYHQMAYNYVREGIWQGFYISMVGVILFLTSLTITQMMKKYKL